MQTAGHLSGGGPVLMRVKIGATFANAGIVSIDGTAGVIPPTTTDFGDSLGLALDTGTYSTTQGDAEGLVTVSRRPDAIIRALMSGGAAEGTQLALLSNTAADTAGLTVTDADVGANDMDSGTVWGIAGANVGQSRLITTFSANTSLAVTVPFLNDLAVADEFLFCPYGLQGSGAAGSDGVGNLQTSTLFREADASIASGTGGLVAIYDLELNGRADSRVLFVLQDHVLMNATV